jgi:hypothetical protein
MKPSSARKAVFSSGKLSGRICEQSEYNLYKNPIKYLVKEKEAEKYGQPVKPIFQLPEGT